MRRGIVLLMILLVISCKRKVNPEYGERNDSVEKYLALASNDSLPFSQRKIYNEKALSFVDLERNDTVTRWYLYKTSDYYIDDNDSLKYYYLSNLHFQKSIEESDTLNLARFFRFRGSYHRKKTKILDSALYYYLKSEKLYLKTNDRFELAKVYIFMGDIKYSYSDYLGAEYSYIKALKLLNGHDNNLYLFQIFNDLGNVNHNLRNFKIAIDYHKKALIKLQKLPKNINYDYTASLNNIGNSYRELKKYHIAINYFKKAIEFTEKNNTLIKEDPYVYNNLAYCYLKTKNYKKVPYLLKKALKLFDSLKIKDEAAISKIYLSNYYIELKDTIKAIQCAEQAIQLAKASRNNNYYLYTLSNAGTINTVKAPTYIAEYHRLNDSLLFQERKARNQFYKIQLETDEIAKEKENAIRQKWVQTAIIATVLLIVILLFIIYRQRSHQKELKLVQSQQEANAEIYRLMLQQQTQTEEVRQHEKQRIALELHDNVMNKLASSRFNLFPLTQNPDQNIQQHASQQAQTLKEIEDEIRNLTHELATPQAAERNSFEDLLQAFTEEQNRKGDLQFTLHLDPSINWDTVASEAKMHLYRIVQEGVHNIRKHAEATQVSIRTIQTENTLGLELQDNGKGFDTTTAHKGIGLQNMQNRMKSVGGTVSIHSHPGKTIIQVCIPSQTKN